MSKIITMTERDLVNIPVVPATATWNPVHHMQVVEALNKGMEERELEVVRKSYEVSQDGKDLFATWRLPMNSGGNAIGHKDAPIIGWRNSMKKRFALGFAAGHNVMVCSNMCLWGDFVEHRKHTSGLTPEVLFDFIMKALDTIKQRQGSYRDWFQKLAGQQLHESSLKELVYDSMADGILTPSHFSRFQTAYQEELKDNQQGASENYAHFHGAVTRTLRGMSIANVQERTIKLNKLIESHLDEWADSDIIDIEPEVKLITED